MKKFYFKSSIVTLVLTAVIWGFILTSFTVNADDLPGRPTKFSCELFRGECRYPDFCIGWYASIFQCHYVDCFDTDGAWIDWGGCGGFQPIEY